MPFLHVPCELDLGHWNPFFLVDLQARTHQVFQLGAEVWTEVGGLELDCEGLDEDLGVENVGEWGRAVQHLVNYYSEGPDFRFWAVGVTDVSFRSHVDGRADIEIGKRHSA